MWPKNCASKEYMQNFKKMTILNSFFCTGAIKHWSKADMINYGGIPIHNKDCLKTCMWNSQGLLGEILCQVHSDLSTSTAIPGDNRGTLV